MRPASLDPPVDPGRDHILGPPGAAITLVEYGSYACPYCHAAHEVVASLRDRFGDRMRYVFRHRPLTGSTDAVLTAELAEQVHASGGSFWAVHDALMQRGPSFTPANFDELAARFDLPPLSAWSEDLRQAARSRIRADEDSAQRSGVLATPTFFINGRRYEGAWDEHALTEAMLGSLGHRLQTAALDFVSWGPSTGLLLLLMSVLALGLVNSPAGPAFLAWWEVPFGFTLGGRALALPLIDWIDHGLLTVFFLVVGLEIKRELTVGRLSTWRSAALPVAASVGGMIVPALIYLAILPSGPLAHGWAVPISTDTAFAVAVIALLGVRVPVALRVFLTAVVIIDDLVVIAAVAIFYSGGIAPGYLAAAAVAAGVLVALNRWSIYAALPYAAVGTVLWVLLHEAGLHPTLAGVVLALIIPTRPPPNVRALMAQAEAVLQAVSIRPADSVIRHGLPEPALRAIDAIHDRIESPAAKMLRTVEPWSSYAVLPLFALANAGVVLSPAVVADHGVLVLAVVLGLVVGKPVGILATARLAVALGFAVKPTDYSWRQMLGAGILAGIGFTMSLFIASQAYSDREDFAAAKIAIFIASLIAGGLGVLVLRSSAGGTLSDDGQRPASP